MCTVVLLLGAPLLGLVGVDSLLEAPLAGANPLAGLAIAFVVLAGVGVGAVLARPISRWWILLPILFAALFALVLPVAVAIRADGPREVVPTARPIPTDKVDVLLIQRPQSGPRQPRISFGLAAADIARWDATYTLATATPRLLNTGEAVRLNAVGLDRDTAHQVLAGRRSPPPLPLLALPWRAGSTRAIVLNVDGIGPSEFLARATRAEPADWQKAVRSALRFGKAPVYVLLARGYGDDAERVARWREWARLLDGEAVLYGDLSRLALVDAALRVATERSETLGDDAVAFRFRPHLYFDSREQWTLPVDVDALFAGGGVRMCGSAGARVCSDEISGPQALDSRYEFLDFREDGCRAPTSARSTLGPRSAIYYRVLPDAAAGSSIVYVDYWWYFPCNPTPTLFNHIACKPGWTIPGLTCHTHESDWEGLTVVLRRTPTNALAPVGVTYAQHEFGIAYEWQALADRWREDERKRRAKGRRLAPYEAGHPLAFVARDSHASYATPCNRRRGCRQIARGFGGFEGQSDGTKAWLYNDSDRCLEVRCLRPLPAIRNGDPALWNAFAGRWGDSSCALSTAICGRGQAPRAPAQQDRWLRPGRPRTGKARVDRVGLPVKVSNY